MTSEQLTLKHTSASRSSFEWTDEDYDVLCDGKVVGRIVRDGPQWFWRIAYEYLRDRSPSDGHEPDQYAAMKAFAKVGTVSDGGDTRFVIAMTRYCLNVLRFPGLMLRGEDKSRRCRQLAAPLTPEAKSSSIPRPS
jgi:hypothetical protein